VDGWGVGELWAYGERVVWHEHPHTPGPPRASSHFEPTGKTITQGAPDGDETVTIFSLVERITAYFAGDHSPFDDVELELDWCTSFQQDVVTSLRDIPYGETVTYGELAALAGRPNAQRAAGSVCAHNRFAIFVPCHRVVSATGLGSYGSLGVGYKRRLLELEGALRGRS
jgi:O-6-methylguanine DNA methyltransferase